MKKTALKVLGLCAVLTLSSCYNSSVCVGDMKKDDPAVKVNTVHNPHFLYGLIGHKKVEASKYVGNAESYRVKRSQSFVDGLLSSITFGIYTPTTTTFYVPFNTSK